MCPLAIGTARGKKKLDWGSAITRAMALMDPR